MLVTGYEHTELGEMRCSTHQEERICEESVGEHRPPCPSSGAFASIERRSDSNGDDDADELVAAVGHEVVDLAVAADVQEIPTEPEHDQLQQDDNACVGEGDAKQLRLEFAVQARNQGGEQNVGDECHGGDVHVGRIDIFARREEFDDGRVGVAASLLPAPGPMAPGKKDDAIELRSKAVSFDCALAYLKSHLCSRVIHEPSKGRVHVAAALPLRRALLLPTIPISALPVLRGWWWRRSQLSQARGQGEEACTESPSIAVLKRPESSSHRRTTCHARRLRDLDNVGHCALAQALCPTISESCQRLISDIFIEERQIPSSVQDGKSSAAYKKDKFTCRYATSKDVGLIFVVEVCSSSNMEPSSRNPNLTQVDCRSFNQTFEALVHKLDTGSTRRRASEPDSESQAELTPPSSSASATDDPVGDEPPPPAPQFKKLGVPGARDDTVDDTTSTDVTPIPTPDTSDPRHHSPTPRTF
ncbi:hypothetical protein MRB53_038380 [Persea americana]|nr:hypothetical protein MRB53_038380 [Persea americana]